MYIHRACSKALLSPSRGTRGPIHTFPEKRQVRRVRPSLHVTAGFRTTQQPSRTPRAVGFVGGAAKIAQCMEWVDNGVFEVDISAEGSVTPPQMQQHSKGSAPSAPHTLVDQLSSTIGFCVPQRALVWAMEYTSIYT